MLDDQDRALLAPHLVRLRQARADLAETRRRLADMPEPAGGWRSRFTAYDREARRTRHELAARVAALELDVERFAAAADDVLDPVLRGRDPQYQRLLMAIRRCDRALAACTAFTDRIASASTHARGMLRALSVNPAIRTPQQEHSELAAARYDEDVRWARATVPDLNAAVERARAGVAAALGVVLAPPSPLDPSAFDDLPVARSTVAARLRIGEALPALGGVARDARELADAVSRWRKAADASRTGMLRAVREAV